MFVVAALASCEALLAPEMQTVFAAQYPAEYTSPIPGQGGYMLCRYQGQKNGHPAAYVTPMFSTGAPERTATVAFVHYMEATYDVDKLQQGSGYCKTVSNSADQRAYTMSLIEKQWTASHTEVIRVAWTNSPGQPAADTAAAEPVASPMQAPAASSSSTGLYLFCSSEPDGPIVYFSDFFVADPDPGGPRGVSFRNVSAAYFAFLKQKYAFNSGSNYPTGCLNATRTDAGMRYAQTHKQQMEDQYRKTGKQIVETGWRYTPAPGAAAPASTTPARLHH
jgi:hypothetical protein